MAPTEIEVLLGLMQVAEEVDAMGCRRPQDVPAVTARERGMCMACPHNPSRVFAGMNAVLMDDVSAFHGAFKGAVGSLQTFSPPDERCLGCVSKTVSDFERLYLVFERFVREALGMKLKAPAAPGEARA